MISYISLTIVTLVMLGGGFFFLINRYASQADEIISETTNQQVLTQLYSFMQERPDIGELSQFIESLEQVRGVSIELIDASGESVLDAYTSNAIFSVNLDPEILELLKMDSQSRNEPLPRSDPLSRNDPLSKKEPPPRNDPLSRNGMMHWGLFFNFGPAKDPVPGEDIIQKLLKDGDLRFSIAGVPQTGKLTISSGSLIKQQLLEPSAFAFGFAALIVLMLSVVIGWRISLSLSRPLRSLTSVVNSMSSGHLEVRAETSSKDEEINRLSAQINDMAGELSATIEDLRQEKDRLKRFLVDASHELRTPVTALSAYLEMLSGKAGEDAERRREYIDICIAQNNRSRDIVVQLLELLRMEQIGDSVSYDRLDAANLFEDSIAMMYPAAQEKRISLQFDTSRQLSDAVVYGNRYQLLTALKNIVENAIKYSPEGSTIVCELSVSEDRVEFIVSDTGMGIQEEELSRVFDRFYRSKKASGKGSGLGLSIVKRVIENHNGIVTLSNRKDVQGARCIISLPKASPHQE